jgi:predicted DsbA family dithiol-disulfide isomerase
MAQIEASRPMLEKRAREQYGLEIHAGPFGIDSRPALIGDKVAEAQGKGPAYHKAAMSAYWQQAQAIDDKEVLKKIATSVGLDSGEFMAGLDNPVFNEQVSEDIELANMYGLSGVPALVFNDKYLVVGAQPYAALKQVVEQIQKEEEE